MMRNEAGGSSPPRKRRRTTQASLPSELREKGKDWVPFEKEDDSINEHVPTATQKATQEGHNKEKKSSSKTKKSRFFPDLSTEAKESQERVKSASRSSKIRSSAVTSEEEQSHVETEDKEVESNDTDGAYNGIDVYSRPLHDIKDMFKDIVQRSLNPGQEIGLQACALHLAGKPMHVATICSGTESPILAMMMIKKAMFDFDPTCVINFDHLFSAEIVPYKQHYIESNFSPPILFSDITELTKDLPAGETFRTATTAYGGKATVPRDVDLLVAGFSCVDFSPLNGQRKTLEARGESGDTFFSLREYAKLYRPKIIILENVSNAPWDHAAEAKKGGTGIDFLMGEIGYSSKWIRANTKDYYLPQTRMRGYMICVDRNLYSKQEFDPKHDLARWAENPLPCWTSKAEEVSESTMLDEETPTFEEFEQSADNIDDHVEDLSSIDKDLREWFALVRKSKRPASVPMDLMLLRSDDPSLEALATQSNQPVRTQRKSGGWDHARVAHHLYRDGLSLGYKRQLTDWVNGGAYVPEDFWKRDQRAMGERVLDCLEVAHLRSLARGFDDRYYSRPLELSQNVFRVEDTTKPGVIGCLTPTGIPFLTSRGGRIIGLEAIALQGLRLEELDFAMLTQANLQDLAGNAMSSTVVGVAIAAALGVFHKKFDVHGRIPAQVQATVEPGFPEEAVLLETIQFSNSYSNKLSRAEALEEVKVTRRLCACEGRLHRHRREFQSCTVCRHSTCKQCGVKPRHHYAGLPDDDLEKRKDPSSFEKLIRRSIPSSISFNLDPNELDMRLQNVDTDAELDFCQMAKDAFSSEVFLRHVRRDEFWEISYDSHAAKLVLTISERKLEWHLYANVDELGIGTKKGKYFRQYPIAKMYPGADDINIGSWSFWIPQEQIFSTKLTWSGEPIKTFGAQRGLESMVGDYVYPTCEISVTAYDPDYFVRDIQGRYKLSQDCGQPQNTLHALQSDKTDQPLFFYCEQHLRSGNARKGDHNFVFTEDTHRLEKLEHRNVIADFARFWRPPLIKVNTPVEDQETRSTTSEDVGDLAQKKYDQHVSKLAKALSVYEQSDCKIVVRGRWVGSASLSMNSNVGTQLTYHCLPPLVGLWPLHGDSCELPSLTAFAFEATLTGKIADSWSKGVWTLITQANESVFMKEFGWALRQGSICVGHTQTDSSWKIIDAGIQVNGCLRCAPDPPPLLWSRTVKNKAIPCEESLEATKYEKALKARSHGLVAKFCLTDHGELLFKIGANPLTLIHRATALLSSTCSAETSLSHLTASWRLITDDETNPNTRYKELTVLPNTYCPGKVEVPGFKQELRIEQEKALVWAKRQDQGQKPFVEEEVVEVRLNNLGYRLEGKSSRQVNRRGGLLFFDVGFGKTPIILALTRSCLEADSNAAKSLMATHPPKDTGKIPLKATLIIVPDHLTKQWEAEAEKFLGLRKTKSKSRILVIESHVKLRKTTVQDFKDAEIIILSWKFITNSAYQRVLAHFAGIVERDETSARVKSLWYDKAKLRVAESVKSLHQDDATPPVVWAQLSREYEKDRKECDMVDAPVPTKRTRGRAYQPVSERECPVVGEKRKRALSINIKQEGKALDVASGQDSNDTTDPKHFDEDVLDNPDESNSEGVKQKSSVKGKKKKKAVNHSSADESIRDGKIFNMNNISDINQMKYPLLEMFSFARIVTDELTYLLDNALALQMVNKLTTPSRFALSGTPNLSNFSGVKTLASMLGIHLGRDDFESMKNEEFAQATKDMSKSELFLTYQSPASTAWHINRQDIAQKFLNTFARKDVANVDEIPCETHYTLVDIHPAHKAIYFELQQRVASSTFETLRSRNVESEVEKQAKEVMCETDDLREALLLRASYVKFNAIVEDTKALQKLSGSAQTSGEGVSANLISDVAGLKISMQNLIAIRVAQYGDLKRQLAHQLKKAFWLQNEKEAQRCSYLRTWIKRVEANGFHDTDCEEAILALIDHASQSYRVDDWQDYYVKPDETAARKKFAKENSLQEFPVGTNENTNTAHLSKVEAHLRTTATAISRNTEVFVNHTRSMRLVQAIDKIQNSSCPCSGCHQILTQPDHATILSACGHVVCAVCLAAAVGDGCPLPGCGVEFRKFEKVLGSEFCDVNGLDESQNSLKVDAIVDVIAEAASKGEKVLLFVQFPKLADMLMIALREKAILFASMTTASNKASTLQKFQKESDKATVLFMDPTGEPAAGANLTNANHVIFATPLYTSGFNSQYKYTSTITQAIGRARRYGQLKTVHVHHFISVNTIDVDLLQHREGKILQRDPSEPSVGVLVNRAPGVQGTLHSPIAHIIYPGVPMTD